MPLSRFLNTKTFFNAFREYKILAKNRILAKISEFTAYDVVTRRFLIVYHKYWNNKYGNTHRDN